ncbi:MAG: asparagine synthase (glutamine-hydrolyzing) [Methanobacteriaceae archaeon]|nr:asparagine synthase (glutamine-hydrolyzing) [Methanobacteriaceae archaeon]
MSGITGIFRRDGKDVDPADIKKMNDKISHRGPDGSRIWCEGPVAFGHQMLHTTPESLHEILPFEDEESGLVITADARIDNRKELAPKLGIEDNEYVSDSYFILKAYEKWGEKCPEELLGDFAFAIWDKNRETLFCARDHMGVKPFYYHLSNDYFLFASEIKSLLYYGEDLNLELNEIKVAYHLIPISTDRKLTFYNNIFRLPASNCLYIEFHNYELKKYWELDPNLRIFFDTDEDYYLKFREIFEKAIKCRLRTIHPIGFELSGGIDSSSVVVMAKKILSKTHTDILTFSLIFNEIKQTDESYYIKKIVDKYGFKPFYLVGDSISPFDGADEILFYQDEPLETPNMAMIWKLYKKMSDKGVKVVIGGHDGDCLLYKGENYLFELFVRFKWFKLIDEIKIKSNGGIVEFFKLFVAEVLFKLVPEFHDIWLHFKGIRREKDFVNINKDFVQKFDLKNLYKQMELYPLRAANNSRRIHYYYLTLATHQQIFEMMDKFAAPHSIEPRHPMMDKRLVEFCFAVPTHIKYDNGWGRLLVRYGLSDLLPNEVQWRRGKINFFHVFERNLLLFERDCLNDLIYKNKLIRKYVDCKELPKIYRRYIEGVEGADSIDIWKIAILSFWLESSFNHLKEN